MSVFQLSLYFLTPAQVLGPGLARWRSPEVDGQLTGQGDNGFLAGSGTGFAIGKQRSPAAEPPLIGLKASYPPGHFDHQAAQARIAVLGDRSIRRRWSLVLSLGQSPK